MKSRPDIAISNSWWIVRSVARWQMPAKPGRRNIERGALDPPKELRNFRNLSGLSQSQTGAPVAPTN
jgi:hypothetical protein